MKNWKNKLASRKLWSAIAGVVVALCAAFGADEMTTRQITAVITAAGVLVAYIFAESYVDANRIESPTDTDATESDIRDTEKQ